MAHKKGQGSTRNGRDSLPKMRGVKRGVRERLSSRERATGAVRLRSVLSAASRRE